MVLMQSGKRSLIRSDTRQLKFCIIFFLTRNGWDSSTDCLAGKDGWLAVVFILNYQKQYEGLYLLYLHVYVELLIIIARVSHFFQS